MAKNAKAVRNQQQFFMITYFVITFVMEIH